jgi:hypothetical protein
MTRKLLFALLGTALVSSHALAADEYPRIGTYAISSPHDYYDPAYQAKLAKIPLSIINYYPGWGESRGYTLDTVAKNVKKINPNTRMFVYVLGESLQIPSNIVWTDYYNKVNSSSWWLYSKGFSGTKVLADFGNEFYIVNISSQSKKDSAGLTAGQWYADWVYKTYASTNPTLDGIYTDNVFWKPRRDGDWNGDGVTDSQSDAKVQGWFRQGYRQYVDRLKTKMPGKMMMANVADWGDKPAVLTEYDQVFNGGVLENIIGETYSIEGRSGGWAGMMERYRKTMAAFAAPKLGIFQQQGIVTDYQAMRYGLASCLLDDGYYAFSDVTHHHYGVPWFDEYDSKLGPATSKPQTVAWQSGVYRRDFKNGIALVNPRGNGPRTVTLEGDFIKLKGSQAPSVNDGSTVRKVTLQDRDGIILLRKAPVRRPAAPGGLTSEPAP